MVEEVSVLLLDSSGNHIFLFAYRGLLLIYMLSTALVLAPFG